jgi:hypothetical protein
VVLCAPPPQGMDDHAENLKKVLKDPVCCRYQIVFKSIVYLRNVNLVGKLENLARLRAESQAYRSYQLAAFDDDSKIRRSFKVLVGQENYAFLVWRDSGEEVVLQVQGLLVGCSLPPLTGRSKYVHLK